MKFGISILDYPRSTESQLKSEGTLGGLSSLDEDAYANRWEAKTIRQLKRRINKKLKEIDMKSVQVMFLSIKK